MEGRIDLRKAAQDRGWQAPGSPAVPTNLIAEAGIIGCCLLGGLATACEAVESVPSGVFFNQDCAEAFDVIRGMVANGSEINTQSFYSEWSVKMKPRPVPSAILQSPDSVPSAAMLSNYEEQVIDCARRRRVIFAAQRLQELACDIAVSGAEAVREAESILSAETFSRATLSTSRQCAMKLTDDLEARCQRNGEPTGFLTGFYDLDAKLDGLQAGEQTIIAARPSQGKTSMALNMVERICLRDKMPTLFVSLEMGTEALMRRLASSWASVAMGDLRSGKLCEKSFEKMVLFNRLVSKSPLQIINGVCGMTISEINSAIRRAVLTSGVKFVIVDYLQKIRPNHRHEKRTYEVAEVSGSLKSIADKCKIALVTVAQLNRESDKEKGRAPRLSDLADSGQIERDADVVGLLKLNADATAELRIAKNRDGELGEAKLLFQGSYCRFVNRGREAG